MRSKQRTHVAQRRRSSGEVKQMKRLHARVRVSTYEFILKYAQDLSLGAALDRMVEELRCHKDTSMTHTVEPRQQ